MLSARLAPQCPFDHSALFWLFGTVLVPNHWYPPSHPLPPGCWTPYWPTGEFVIVRCLPAAWYLAQRFVPIWSGLETNEGYRVAGGLRVARKALTSAQ